MGWLICGFGFAGFSRCFDLLGLGWHVFLLFWVSVLGWVFLVFWWVVLLMWVLGWALVLGGVAAFRVCCLGLTRRLRLVWGWYNIVWLGFWFWAADLARFTVWWYCAVLGCLMWSLCLVL